MTVLRTHLLLVVVCLSGCKLYSIQDGCGPGYDGGATCVVPTTGSGTAGGTGTSGGTSGGTTGATNCGAAGLPCAPGTVVATGAKDSVDLTWGAASGNGSTVTGYIVTSTPSGGPGALNLGAVTAAVFPSLTPGTSYTFSVVALNPTGQGPATVSNAAVPFDVPGAPTDIVVDAGQSQVVVSWTAAAGNGLPITSYTVSATPGTQVAMSDGGDTTATVTGLQDYTDYTFSVVANNQAGAGPAAVSGAATPFAIVTTLAGDGDAGWNDGPGDQAVFDIPTGIAVGKLGFVYVADNEGNRIRKIAPDGTTSTLSGNPAVCAPATGCFADGTGGPNGMAAFFNPLGVAVDLQGQVFVADVANERIREILQDGTTSTLAGNGDAGYVEGVGVNASFNTPLGVAVDSNGIVYVADGQNCRIREIAVDGTTSTLSGSGDAGFQDGTGANAAFREPYGLAVDAQGTVYVADTFNSRIRKITSDGTTTTLAGNGDAGFADGTGGPSGTAMFYFPFSVAVDSQGYVYVADGYNSRIRKIAPDGTTITLAGNPAVCDAGGGFAGGCFADGTGGDGGAAFDLPVGVAVDDAGRVFVSDADNGRIRIITQ